MFLPVHARACDHLVIEIAKLAGRESSVTHAAKSQHTLSPCCVVQTSVPVLLSHICSLIRNQYVGETNDVTSSFLLYYNIRAEMN